MRGRCRAGGRLGRRAGRRREPTRCSVFPSSGRGRSTRSAPAARRSRTAAALVRAIGRRPSPTDRSDPQVVAWREEARPAARRARPHARSGGSPTVELPSHLSVSQLVELRRDPAELARQIRRPLPRQPALTARRGTRFHLWLEQRWGQQRLLDVDELPGAADDTADPDADLLALQEAFQASEWWARVPTDVEFPFDIVVDGLLLRGRCDAVFTDADGMVDVVDWKTGQPKSGADADGRRRTARRLSPGLAPPQRCAARPHPGVVPLRRRQPHGAARRTCSATTSWSR